jgi:hypothetical protein
MMPIIPNPINKYPLKLVGFLGLGGLVDGSADIILFEYKLVNEYLFFCWYLITIHFNLPPPNPAKVDIRENTLQCDK